MNNATIFLNLTAWTNGEAKCFGVRFDTQYLPQSSVVVGFICGSDAVIDNNWHGDGLSTAVAYANAVLDDQHDVAEKLDGLVL